MKTCFSIGILVLAGLLLCSPVCAATYDLTGTWDHNRVPNPGSPESPTWGTCVIVQTGDAFTFAFTSGEVCNPPGCCTFSGTVIGNVYTCSTTDIVDDEGGSVTTTIVFAATSATSATGTGTSQYTPASGPESTWSSTIYLTKTGGEPPITYTLTVNQTGNGNVTLDPDGGVYNAGTTVTLTADPAAGWRFDSWSEDAEGSLNPYEIVMNEDKTVSGTFTRMVKSSAGTLHLLLDD